MKKFSTYIPYPLIMTLTLILGHKAWTELDAGLALVLTVSTGFTMVALFEYFFPETLSWRPVKREIILDIFHSAISNTLPNLLFKVIFFGLAIKANQTIEGWIGLGLWPESLPLVAQVFLGLCLAEIGFYALHRTCHESRLWPLHSLHHSVERMYILAGSRTHPLQIFFTYGAQMAILWVAGAPDVVIYFHAVFTSINGLLQHANIKMNFGFLSYIFATPEVHRWHHSQVIKESNNNYGTNIILWDHVFRSFYLPADRAMPERLGLMPEDVIPLTLKDHMMSAFRKY